MTSVHWELQPRLFCLGVNVSEQTHKSVDSLQPTSISLKRFFVIVALSSAISLGELTRCVLGI